MNYKKLYKNGDLRILGSKNLYGKWNNLMFWLWTKRNTDLMPFIMSLIISSGLLYLIYHG